MRNEIFAEYGYRFKSEDWSNYFSQKSWYSPRYDDVNDQLTEIDEMKQYEMAQRFAPAQYPYMRYLIGDVRTT